MLNAIFTEAITLVMLAITMVATTAISITVSDAKVFVTWATNMMAAAQQAVVMEEECISRGTARTTKLDFMTEEEVVDYACEQLAGKYRVPMI